VAGVPRRRHVRLRDADRNARNGWLFTRFATRRSAMRRTGIRYAPLDEQCGCYNVPQLHRALSHHLHRVGEILGAQLNTTTTCTTT